MLVLLLSVLALSAHNVRGECEVGAWSSFSEWTFGVNMLEEGLDSTSQESAVYTEDHAALVDAVLEEAWVRSADVQIPDLTARPFAECVNGSAAEFACNNINLLGSFLPVDLSFPNTPQGDPKQRKATDIWGWTDFEGSEYVIANLAYGTSFLRLDAAAPEGAWRLAFMSSNVDDTGNGVALNYRRDGKVINDFLFVGAEIQGHGIQVYHLLALTGFDPVADGADVPLVLPANNHVESIGIGASNNLVTIEGSTTSRTLFVLGARNTTAYPEFNEGYVCGGGIVAIDVSNPYDPSVQGCYNDSYVNDCHCVEYSGPDAAYAGREVCVCTSEMSVLTLDVTDKANMVLIGSASYASNTSFSNAHQGWMNEGQSIFFQGDNIDELHGADRSVTRIWDISVLSAPVLANTYFAPEAYIDNNQYVVGNYLYQANFEGGLRVLSIDEPTFSLSEVAYFDTYSDPTDTELIGMYGVYPFFMSTSGVVAASDEQRGVFILQPNLLDMSLLSSTGLTYRQRSRHRNVVNANDATDCPLLQDIETILMEPIVL